MSIYDSWQVRLTGAQHTQSRTRYAFIAAIVISIAIIIAEFNSTFSWYVSFTSKPTFATSLVTAQAQKELVDEWIKSNRVTISLLGVNFGMSDAAILGSISLYILSLWFFACIRRENHYIADMLVDASELKDKDIASMVFNGITAYMVFTTLTKDDKPRDRIEPAKPTDQKLLYFRPTLKALIYLPALGISFIVFTDIISLFLPAPLREDHQLLFTYLKDDFWSVVHLVVMDALALILSVITFTTCTKIVEFEEATGKMLRTFYDTIQSAVKKPI